MQWERTTAPVRAPGRDGGLGRDEPATGALPTPALLLVVALTAGVVAQGAYYPEGQQVMVAVLAAALVSALWAQRWSAVGDGTAPALAAGALAAWAVVSAVVAGHAAAAGSTVALLGGIVVVLVVCRRTTAASRDALVGAVVAVGVVAATTGWVGVAWRVSPWALEDGGLWRAATVLTYANATSGLLVPLALMAAARLVRNRRAPVPVACLCLLLVGVGATLSRAGFVALLVGTGVLVLLLRSRQVVSAVAAPAIGAAIALGGLAFSMPTYLPARPVVAVAALGAGLAVAITLARAGRRGLSLALPVIALLTLVALVPPLPTAGALAAIGSPRLNLVSPDRTLEARAALEVVADRPVTGAGPGQALLTWAAPDGSVLLARYAHNEYLQTAAELGVVGLALLVLLLAAFGRAVWRGRDGAPSPELWAGAVAGLVALVLHSAFDFLWHVPVIPLAGALLAGVTLHERMETTRES